jgi:hypothetical protein
MKRKGMAPACRRARIGIGRSLARLLLMLLTGLLPAVVAAAPTYTPDRVELDLAPGGSTTFSYTIAAPGAFAVAPYMWYVEQTLPAAWLGQITAAWAWFATSADQEVTVSVPGDAAPGSYLGTLYGLVSGGAHSAERGAGVSVVVTVTGGCSEHAEFVAASENDFELWAPNRALRRVELRGGIRIPAGCTLLSAGWQVDDEYGQYSSQGELEIGDDGGSYRAAPLLEVWRDGRDRDGRSYTVTLTLETEAGRVTRTRTVVVRHDRRERADRQPRAEQAEQ